MTDAVSATGWQAFGYSSYEEYLASHAWREKRKLVLEKNPTCTICNKNKATQVHHLTYEHVCNEPSKDLQAVCYDCHKREHEKK